MANIIAVVSGSCVIFVVILFLIIFSFEAIEPLEIGIRASSFYRNVNLDKVYYPGRHFIGISSFFFIYPTTVQLIDFSEAGVDGSSLRCWSRDGQLIYVDVSFFYEFDINKIASIFQKYERNWKEPIVHIARGAIKSTTTFFNTTDFFSERTVLKESIRTSLEEALGPEGFNVLDVQLRKIDIPGSFEGVIESKQVSAQNATTELYKRNQTIVEAETLVIQEKAQQEVNRWKALANGDTAILIANATATGFKMIQEANAQSYSTLSNEFNFTSLQLLEYVYSSKISERKSRLKLSVGFPKPVLSTTDDKTSYTIAVQTVTTTATANDIGGSMTLSLGGATSTTIAFDASVDAFKTAVESMSTVGVVSVIREAVGNGNVWTVTFLSNTGALPNMSLDTTSLTGTDVDAEVTTTVPGSGPSNAFYSWN